MIDLEDFKRGVSLSAYVASDLGAPKRRDGYTSVFSCPFHKDDSPSFVVYDSDQHFHCYGCSAHGDLITYLQMRAGVSFKEALQMLGAKTDLPRREPEEVAPEKKQSPLTFLDAQRYHSNLAPVKSYLEQRGIPESLIDSRVLGADTHRQSRNYLDLNGKRLSFSCSRCSIPYIWSDNEVYSFNFRRNDADALDCLKRMGAHYQCDMLERMRLDIAAKEDLDPTEITQGKILDRCFGPRFYRPHTRVTAYGVNQIIRREGEKLIYPRRASALISEGEFDSLSAEAEGFLCIALKAVKGVDVRRLFQNVRLVYVVVDPDEAGETYANMLLTAFQSDYSKVRKLLLPDRRDMNQLHVAGELAKLLSSKPYFIERAF